MVGIAACLGGRRPTTSNDAGVSNSQKRRDFTEADLPTLPEDLGLASPLPVVVIIGGASNLDEPSDEMPDGEDLEAIRESIERTFLEALRPAVRQTGAVVLTGGTEAGVMRIAGEALSDAASALIGVVPAEMVGDPPKAVLDKNHTAAVLTSGVRWGSETETLFDLAERISGGTAPGIVVLANGGGVSLEEARRFLRGGWPILTVPKSGGAADRLIDAVEEAKTESEWGDLKDADVEELAEDHLLARRQLLWRLHPDELLKSAWATFASYDLKATELKRSAKRTRVVLTGLSVALLVAITAIVQIAALGWVSGDGALDPDLRATWLGSTLPVALTLLKWTVLALPVGIAVAVALGSFSGSQVKWRSVRACAETLKREIYRYRSLRALNEPEATRRLAAVLHVVDDEAIRAGIGLAEAPPGLLRGRPQNIDVDELETLNARIYVKRRLEHQVLWFNGAARARGRRELVVVVSGAVAAAVAMALVTTRLAPWVALLVLAATVFTFSRERGVTGQQILGFDRAIADVNDAWVAWLQRTPADRRQTKSVAEFVDAVENAFERESLTWSEVMRRAAGPSSSSLGMGGS